MSKFIPGMIYFCFSSCDQNCRWYYKVVSRTEKTIKVSEDGGAPKTLRVNSDRYGEYVMPLGRYSMAPVLRADNRC